MVELVFLSTSELCCGRIQIDNVMACIEGKFSDELCGFREGEVMVGSDFCFKKNLLVVSVVLEKGS